MDVESLTFSRRRGFAAAADSLLGEAVATRAAAANAAKPVDRDQCTVLLRELTRREMALAPMQTAVHPSSLILGRLLWQHPASVAGKRVLGLGSGRGLAALVAAHCGAAEVTMTDGSASSVKLLRENIALNVTAGCSCDDICAHTLVWDAAGGGDCGDGRGDVDGRFDLIVAADCAYEGAEYSRDLLATISRRLGETGRAVLVSPSAAHRAGMATLLDALEREAHSLRMVRSSTLGVDAPLLRDAKSIHRGFGVEVAADVQSFSLLVIQPA